MMEVFEIQGTVNLFMSEFREISNFFIFCPSNLYSEVFSKITLKVSTAFHFFFEIWHIGLLRTVNGKVHIYISLVR